MQCSPRSLCCCTFKSSTRLGLECNIPDNDLVHLRHTVMAAIMLLLAFGEPVDRALVDRLVHQPINFKDLSVRAKVCDAEIPQGRPHRQPMPINSFSSLPRTSLAHMEAALHQSLTPELFDPTSFIAQVLPNLLLVGAATVQAAQPPELRAQPGRSGVPALHLIWNPGG